MRAASWFAVLSVCLLASPAALAADVVRDRSEFSVDLTQADLCFFEPIELRRDEPCATFTPDAAQVPPPTDKIETIASAGKRMPNGDVLAVIVVHGFKGEDRVTKATLKKKAAEYRAGLTKGLPHEAMVGEPSARIVQQGSAPALRMSIDVKGLTSPELRSMEHHATLYLYGEHDVYGVTVMGPESSRADIEALLDEIAPSVILTTPRTTKDLSQLVGRLIAIGVMAVMAIAGIIVAIAYDRRRARLRNPPPRADGYNG